MKPPEDHRIREDWAEYSSTYKFKDGSFTVERHFIVKKNTVPLDQWDQYLAFRRAMFDDFNQQSLIAPTKSSR